MRQFTETYNPTREDITQALEIAEPIIQSIYVKCGTGESTRKSESLNAFEEQRRRQISLVTFPDLDWRKVALEDDDLQPLWNRLI